MKVKEMMESQSSTEGNKSTSSDSDISISSCLSDDDPFRKQLELDNGDELYSAIQAFTNIQKQLKTLKSSCFMKFNERPALLTITSPRTIDTFKTIYPYYSLHVFMMNYIRELPGNQSVSNRSKKYMEETLNYLLGVQQQNTSFPVTLWKQYIEKFKLSKAVLAVVKTIKNKQQILEVLGHLFIGMLGALLCVFPPSRLPDLDLYTISVVARRIDHPDLPLINHYCYLYIRMITTLKTKEREAYWKTIQSLTQQHSMENDKLYLQFCEHGPISLDFKSKKDQRRILDDLTSTVTLLQDKLRIAVVEVERSYDSRMSTDSGSSAGGGEHGTKRFRRENEDYSDAYVTPDSCTSNKEKSKKLIRVEDLEQKTNQLAISDQQWEFL